MNETFIYYYSMYIDKSTIIKSNNEKRYMFN